MYTTRRRQWRLFSTSFYWYTITSICIENIQEYVPKREYIIHREYTSWRVPWRVLTWIHVDLPMRKNRVNPLLLPVIRLKNTKSSWNPTETVERKVVFRSEFTIILHNACTGETYVGSNNARWRQKWRDAPCVGAKRTRNDRGISRNRVTRVRRVTGVAG